MRGQRENGEKPGGAAADTPGRARSDVAKAARRAAILDAARAMIAEAGFDGVTMDALARRAGLAKGTLYLYVATKEELFLLLYRAALTDYVDRFESLADPHTLAEDMTRLAEEVPLFLPLFARLVAVIEANVSDAALFEAKRAFARLGGRVGAHLAALLALPPGRAGEVVNALLMAMQGAAQFDLSARRDPASLPEDLREIFAAHAFARSFPPAARLILAGAR